MQTRLKKLSKLEEDVRVAMLGADPQYRLELERLRDKVCEAIRREKAATRKLEVVQ